MSDIKLGELITGDAQRDAIHIAIAPVEADEPLLAGERVGLLPSGKASTSAEKLIGIVDPFLRQRIKAGDRFWLCLYQNTVTGMRHHWAHPEFRELAQTISATDAEKTVREFCEQYGVDYDDLLSEFGYAEYFTVLNYSGPFDNEEEVKRCLCALTGKSKDFFFSCSC